MTLSQEQQVLYREIRGRLRHLPDGHDKDEHLVIIAYEMGLEAGKANPSEETRKEIRKEVLLEFLDLLERKKNSLSGVNMNDIQAIAIGWLDIELTDLWQLVDIPDLPPEFLGNVMKHQMWAEEARKEKDNASD